MGQVFSAQISLCQPSSYYSQVHGAVDVCDVHHSLHYCGQGPVGTIALLLAAVSPFFYYSYLC